jgi:hypothetical protein
MPMLTIRKEQMAVFREPAINDYVKRVVVHLSERFPEKCEALGDPKVSETVKYGIQRSASYGIATEGDVRRYIDLMIMFGPDFDQDPELPWASSILNNRTLINPTTKIERLYKAVKKQEKLGGAGRGRL